MAKQTLKSLLGSSDERKQVELNLNPVALQPTIRSGGNYRVAVQDTPKTNSALQLADALRQGVGLYGQAVNIAQDKAREDVASMSEEDFDKFLTEGLDKDSRNIFGYTKAYNQALAKKYYAEEMPMKLQAIAAELHKDPYAYKDPAQFEGAAIAAVNEAYDEADELLGGNVFSEQANNALKSATKADFVAKQQATYLQRMPEITRQNASEGAFNAFSKITKADTEAKAMIDAQIKSVTEAVGNRKEAAAIVTKAYLDNIEALAKQEGQEGLAQALLDELHSGEAEEKAGLQGKRQFGDDKVELFNTAENRGRIEDLEDAIENAGVSGYNAKILRAKEATATIQLDVYTLIKGEGGSEEAGIARLNELRDEIVKNQSLTLGDSTYNDSIEITEILNFIDGAASNKDLFVHNAKLNFLNQNIGAKRAVPNQMVSTGSLNRVNPSASALLFSSKPDGFGEMQVTYTQEGLNVIDEFGTELEQLELQLIDSLLSDSSLSQGDRITEFSKRYPTEVNAKLQEWLTNRLEEVVPVKGSAEAAVSDQREADAKTYLSEKERLKIKDSALNIEQEKEITDIRIQQEKDDEYLRQSVIVFGETAKDEDNRQLRGRPPLPSLTHSEEVEAHRNKPPIHKEVSKSYDKAEEFDVYNSEEEKIRLHSQLVSSWESPRSMFDGSGVSNVEAGSSVKDTAYQAFAYKRKYGGFAEDNIVDRAAKRKKMVGYYNRYGVSANELLNDAPDINKYWRQANEKNYKTDITISGMFGGVDKVDFRLFPITVNGSVATTAQAVTDYFKAKEAGKLDEFDAGNFALIAEKYDISLDALMTAQQTYLTPRNFITK